MKTIFLVNHIFKTPYPQKAMIYFFLNVKIDAIFKNLLFYKWK